MRRKAPALVPSSLRWVAAGLVLIAGCAAGGEEPTSQDESALVALESEIGYDGAVARLDEPALTRIDAQGKALEDQGAAPSTIEKMTTRSVLVAVLRGGAPHASATTSIKPLAIYDSDLFKLNGQEQALCKDARLVCVRVALAAIRARIASQAEYSDGNVGGRIDAFRHTYWNALMANGVGVDHAKAWADAHENGYPDNRATEKARVLSDMDFHNNAEGRRVGADGGDLKAEVRDAMARGTLRAVRYDRAHPRGVLVPTSQCTETSRCGS